MDKGKIKVMTFGTFDFFHPGHLHYLKKAKEKGDYLVVVIANDSTVKNLKKHPALFSQKERAEIVKSLRFVDKVILAGPSRSFEERLKVIKDEKPDIIALGYDQKVDVWKLREFLKANKINAKILRIKPYHADEFKSSKIKKLLNLC